MAGKKRFLNVPLSDPSHRVLGLGSSECLLRSGFKASSPRGAQSSAFGGFNKGQRICLKKTVNTRFGHLVMFKGRFCVSRTTPDQLLKWLLLQSSAYKLEIPAFVFAQKMETFRSNISIWHFLGIQNTLGIFFFGFVFNSTI